MKANIMWKTAALTAVTLMLLLAGCGEARVALPDAGPGGTPAPQKVQDTPGPQMESSIPAAADGTPEAGRTPGGSEAGEAGSGTPAAETGGDTMLSEERAKELALAHAEVEKDRAVFHKVKTEVEDGRQVYELEFYTDDGTEYEYELDAYTGQVLKYSREQEEHHGGHGGGASPTQAPSQGISAQEAKELAFGRVPGAAQGDIWEFEQETDDGRLVYEGKIVFGGVEYEFEIDAGNGSFLSWDEEPADG